MSHPHNVIEAAPDDDGGARWVISGISVYLWVHSHQACKQMRILTIQGGSATSYLQDSVAATFGSSPHLGHDPIFAALHLPLAP